MADVSKFVLDNVEISVKDDVARSEAESASAQVSSLGERVTTIEALSRLTVAYSSSTSTITFTSTTH